MAGKRITVENGYGDRKQIREEMFQEIEQIYQRMRENAKRLGLPQEEIDKWRLRLVKEEN